MNDYIRRSLRLAARRGVYAATVPRSSTRTQGEEATVAPMTSASPAVANDNIENTASSSNTSSRTTDSSPHRLSPSKRSHDDVSNGDHDQENQHPDTGTQRGTSAPHPSLEPPVGSLVFANHGSLSLLSLNDRAALYSVELCARDEAIASMYTDPIAQSLVTATTARLVDGRYYYHVDTLEQLYQHGLQQQQQRGEDCGSVTNPLNRNEEWSLEQVYRAKETILATYDLERIQAAQCEYESRRVIREAWEEQRAVALRTEQSTIAQQRRLQGQAGTQPTIQELSRDEVPHLYVAQDYSHALLEISPGRAIAIPLPEGAAEWDDAQFRSLVAFSAFAYRVVSSLMDRLEHEDPSSTLQQQQQQQHAQGVGQDNGSGDADNDDLEVDHDEDDDLEVDHDDEMDDDDELEVTLL